MTKSNISMQLSPGTSAKLSEIESGEDVSGNPDAGSSTGGLGVDGNPMLDPFDWGGWIKTMTVADPPTGAPVGVKAIDDHHEETRADDPDSPFVCIYPPPPDPDKVPSGDPVDANPADGRMVGPEKSAKTDPVITGQGAYGGNVKLSLAREESALAQLVQAMATFSGKDAGFNSASVAQAPSDPALQSAIAAAWH